MTADPRDADGNSITGRAVSWNSSDTTLATISTNGTVTGVRLGVATITASSGGTSATASVTIIPAQIRDCVTIQAPGSYIVNADIGAHGNGAFCLNVTNTSDVSIDCEGHRIYSLHVISVVRFSMRQCLVEQWTPADPGAASFSGENLSELTIDRNEFAVGFVVKKVQGVISNNKIGGPGINVAGSTGLTILGNLIEFHPQPGPYAVSAAGIYLTDGTGDRVSGNTIDGGWDGDISNRGSYGADDGIVLAREDRAIVEDNVIRNSWDAGIESASSVSNSIIRNNSIANTVIGLGGWSDNNHRNNVYSGNAVTRASSLVTFFYVKTPAAEFPCLFSGNQFLNNRLTGQVSRGNYTAQNAFEFPGTCTVENNTLQGNDYGGQPLFIDPAAGFNQ